MPLSEEGLVTRIALRHSISQDAVRTILRALRSGSGSMAQFSHPEFGGMSQWSPGMTMVGDMFNNGLKSKLDAVCSELATYVVETPLTARGVIARPSKSASERRRKVRIGGLMVLERHHRVGAQNELRYAVFPRRLAIKDGEHVEIYDTGNHRISGVAQAQSADQTLTFVSQDGLVRVKDLPKVAAKR